MIGAIEINEPVSYVAFSGAVGQLSPLILFWNKMNTIDARQAVLSDLDALVPMFDAYRQFYGQPSNVVAARAFLSARFDHGESVLFIAFQKGAAVGFTQLYPSFSSIGLARSFVLNDLFVVQSARRQGVATKLLVEAIDYARTLGSASLELATAFDNHAAQALYQAEGWRRDEHYLVYRYAL